MSPKDASGNSKLRLGVLALSAVLTTPAFALAAGGGHELPSVWAVIPFIVLLGMIATGPLFYHHFWERNYPAVSIALGLVTIAYYAFALNDLVPIYHEFVEYVSFLALLGSLFVASGTILIDIDKEGTPIVNVIILFIGSVMANFIGTTGASMLLIRPFMRVNRGRVKAYHIIFFIFLVSNIGGGLTPIGDPPLFMGFLRGVPFFWVLGHVWHIWLLTVGLVLAVFYVFDVRDLKKSQGLGGEIPEYSGRIRLKGTKGIGWLVVILISVFLDPNVIAGFPSLQDMYHLPFGIRELIMFSVCFLAYYTADKEALAGNDFNFEPIKEVGFLFIGIFMTMVPALQLIAYEAKAMGDALTPGLMFFGTGALSGFLDNTPTYINFFAAALGKYSLDPNSVEHVRLFASCPETIKYLEAISMGAVFFGAMTYIGNGPNFMVKAISDQNGVKTPSFFGYMVKYAIPILIPIFILIWALFYNLPSGDHDQIRVDCPEIHEIMQSSPGAHGSGH